MPDLLGLFSENLKRLRESKGLSQGELGKQIGKSASYVSQLESGSINTTLETIGLLSEAMAVNPSELLSNVPAPLFLVETKISNLQRMYDKANQELLSTRYTLTSAQGDTAKALESQIKRLSDFLNDLLAEIDEAKRERNIELYEFKAKAFQAKKSSLQKKIQDIDTANKKVLEFIEAGDSVQATKLMDEIKREASRIDAEGRALEFLKDEVDIAGRVVELENPNNVLTKESLKEEGKTSELQLLIARLSPAMVDHFTDIIRSLVNKTAVDESEVGSSRRSK